MSDYPGRSEAAARLLARLGFAPLGATPREGPVLRMLFVPSFHPSVAVEIEDIGAAFRLSVASRLLVGEDDATDADDYLAWARGEAPREPWLRRGDVPAEASLREELNRQIALALEEPVAVSQRRVLLDGMRVTALYRDRAGDVSDLGTFHAHGHLPARDALRRLVCRIVLAAFLDDEAQQLVRDLDRYWSAPRFVPRSGEPLVVETRRMRRRGGRPCPGSRSSPP